MIEGKRGEELEEGRDVGCTKEKKIVGGREIEWKKEKRKGKKGGRMRGRKYRKRERMRKTSKRGSEWRCKK